MSRQVLLVAAIAPFLLGSTAPTGPAASLDRLGWMAGCWEARGIDRVVEEQWMLPRGSVMLGMGRTTIGGQTRGYEHLLIRQDSAGLVYRAAPPGQPAVEFRSMEFTDSTVSFANPNHDFPQQIHYRSAAGGDSLLARIAGTIDEGVRAADFPYGRVACPDAG